MAILRSSDGKFYEVADEELESKLIPAEEIKEKLGNAGNGPARGPGGSGPGPDPGPDMTVPGTGGQVVIQIHTGQGGGYDSGPGPESQPAQELAEVEAHNWCWRRNFFCNHWRRNCWRNHCHRW